MTLNSDDGSKPLPGEWGKGRFWALEQSYPGSTDAWLLKGNSSQIDRISYLSNVRCCLN